MSRQFEEQPGLSWINMLRREKVIKQSFRLPLTQKGRETDHLRSSQTLDLTALSYSDLRPMIPGKGPDRVLAITLSQCGGHGEASGRYLVWSQQPCGFLELRWAGCCAPKPVAGGTRATARGRRMQLPALRRVYLAEARPGKVGRAARVWRPWAWAL